MPRPGPRRRTYLGPGFVLVSLGTAGRTHDGDDPVHRWFDPFARGQVTGNAFERNSSRTEQRADEDDGVWHRRVAQGPG